MNYQTLYDIFRKEYGGKDWRILATEKKVATLFAKWLVRHNYLKK